MVKWFHLLYWSVSCLGQLGLGFEDLENFALSLIQLWPTHAQF